MSFSLADLLSDTAPQAVEALSLDGEWLQHHGYERLEAWPDFEGWTHLAELSLAGNALAEACFSTPWPSLQRLDLSENQLEHTAGWEHLFRLQHLDLAHNLLTTWPDLGKNEQLQHLNLSHNALGNPPSQRLPANLRWLALSGNRRIKSLAALAGHTKLEALFIKQLRLEDYTFLAALPQLQELYFSPIRPEDLTQLTHFQGLTTLHVSLNLLGTAAELPPMPSLRRLTLTRAEQPWASPLAGLDQLEELHLTGNQWEQWPPMHLPKLTHLSARRNLLRELPDLQALPQLQVLDLRNNPLSPGVVQQAQAIKPGLSVWV